MFVATVALYPYDCRRIRITAILSHPRQGCLVLKIHPVRFSWQYMCLVDKSCRVGLLEGIHFKAPLCIHTVAVVGGIVASTPYHEWQVTQGEQVDIAGMACHH